MTYLISSFEVINMMIVQVTYMQIQERENHDYDAGKIKTPPVISIVKRHTHTPSRGVKWTGLRELGQLGASEWNKTKSSKN